MTQLCRELGGVTICRKGHEDIIADGKNGKRATFITNIFFDKLRNIQHSEIEWSYICLQTMLLLFKFANHRNKRFFVSTANEALVGKLMVTLRAH